MPRGPAVLIVEDHIDLLSTLVHLLQEEGMDVFGAGDGPSAAMMMRTGRPPDLIVLDLDLPWVSGQDLLRGLRQDPLLQRIPVLVVTGSDADCDGADAILRKPVPLDELLRVVYGLLGGAGAAPGSRRRRAHAPPPP